MQRDFFLVLPSNASMEIFPSNSLCEYKNQLAEPIDLPGQWVCALTELHYTASWINVPRNQHIQVIAYSGRDEEGKRRVDVGLGRMEIGHGYYKDGEQLVDAIKDVWRGYWENVDEKLRTAPDELPMGSKIIVPAGTRLSHLERLTKRRHDVENIPEIESNSLHIEYNRHSELAKFTLASSKHQLRISAGLSSILNISTNEVVYEEADWVSNRRKAAYISQSPVQLSIGNRRMFIYTNIIQDIGVGDTKAPLLRIVNIDQTTAGSKVEIFNRPQYVPVKTNRLHTIEIILRNEVGRLIEFQYGLTICVLHFKRELF